MDMRAQEVAFDFMHSHNLCQCPLSAIAKENMSKGNRMNENNECQARQLSEDLLNHFQMENVMVSS